MYMKDLNHKMTLRLTDELYEYVNKMSDTYQITPSDFIRQCIGLHKSSQEKANELYKSLGAYTSNELTNTLKGVLENGIDLKTNINNKL